MTKRNFGKDYKTPRELVTLLENRGLIINDRQKAQLYLESIGYYRLSAYMHPLLKTPKILHLYKEGATFNYERNNYEAIFRNDLAKAQYPVIIAVPKIKFKYKPVIMSTLANIIHNGVTVAVHIKEEGANEIELKNTGMDVVCNKEQTLQCAIIDKSIVWYGNINFFGYNSERNNVMRIADHKIANEMIEILYSDTVNDVNGG